MKKYRVNIGDKILVINTNLTADEVKANQPQIIQGLLHEMDRQGKPAMGINPMEFLRAAINRGDIKTVEEIQEFLASCQNGNARPPHQKVQEKTFKQIFATVINPSNNATAKFRFENVTTKEGKIALEIILDEEHRLKFKTPYEGGMKTINFHGYFVTISEM
jgi:hypothetical protein